MSPPLYERLLFWRMIAYTVQSALVETKLVEVRGDVHAYAFFFNSKFDLLKSVFCFSSIELLLYNLFDFTNAKVISVSNDKVDNLQAVSYSRELSERKFVFRECEKSTSQYSFILGCFFTYASPAFSRTRLRRLVDQFLSVT